MKIFFTYLGLSIGFSICVSLFLVGLAFGGHLISTYLGDWFLAMYIIFLISVAIASFCSMLSYEDSH